MNIKKTTIAMALSLLTASVGADEQDDYQAGHLAMAKQNWSLASEKFAAAASDKDLADSATYWQAYVLYQNKQNGKARALLKKLQREFPRSQWVDDAQILMAEHGDLRPPRPTRVTSPNSIQKPPSPPRVGNRVTPVMPPEAPVVVDELKLFAIQQLLDSNPTKAIEMLKPMLADQAPIHSKSNALHLLGIADIPGATDVLYDYIEKAKDSALKAQAIQMLGLRGGEENQKRLAEMYEKAQEKSVKSAIINSFIHGENGDLMARMIAREKDHELSRQMMHMLGAMGESGVLKGLYQKAEEAERKAALLESLAMAGESKTIKDVIAKEKNQELRRAAMHSLMMLGETDSEYALDLYRDSDDIEDKRTLATLLMMTDVDADVVKGFYQEAEDAELKRQLLSVLITRHSLEALESVYMNETDPVIKNEILHHLAAVGEPDQIRRLAVKDPSIKNSEGYFMALGLSGEDEDMQELVDQYVDASNENKEHILHALMMQGDIEWLMKAYKNTSDKSEKKRILRTIGMIDPEALLDLIEEK